MKEFTAAEVQRGISDETNNKKIEITSLYNDYGNSLLRAAYLIVKDKQLAEDVIQEVFLSLYVNYDSFRGDSAINTYIYRIMINKCREKIRKNWFRKRIDINSVENTIVADNQESKLIQKMFLNENIWKLNQKYKEVIVLFYYNNLSVKEIADVLNITESNVKVRLKRGRDKLKDHMIGDDIYER